MCLGTEIQTICLHWTSQRNSVSPRDENWMKLIRKDENWIQIEYSRQGLEMCVRYGNIGERSACRDAQIEA
jgi:hypothetical protein